MLGSLAGCGASRGAGEYRRRADGDVMSAVDRTARRAGHAFSSAARRIVMALTEHEPSVPVRLNLPLLAYVAGMGLTATALSVWLTPHRLPDGPLLLAGAGVSLAVALGFARGGPGGSNLYVAINIIHLSMAVLAGPPGVLVSYGAECLVEVVHSRIGWVRAAHNLSSFVIGATLGWGVYTGIAHLSGPRWLIVGLAGSAALAVFELQGAAAVCVAVALAHRRSFWQGMAEWRPWMHGMVFGTGVPLLLLSVQQVGAGALLFVAGPLLGLQIVMRPLLGTHARLQSAQSRLARLIGTAPLLLFTTDQEGMVTLADGALATGLAARLGGLVGRRIDELPEMGPGLAPLLARTLEGGTTRATIAVADSILEGRLSPLEDPEGAVCGCLGVATDVTEEQRSELGRRTRQRIADSVHDDPLQLLALAVMDLDKLAAALPPDSTRHARAEEARQRLFDVDDRLRANLMPDAGSTPASPAADATHVEPDLVSGPVRSRALPWPRSRRRGGGGLGS